MSTALAAAARVDEPLARVLAFSRRFGAETTALAMHAALPLGLSPELVHLLRVNFVPRAPFIAEADLLLSPLCTEAGGGMYEMDADVRELLLAEMARTPRYGPAQQRRVAGFLRLWAARALDETADPDLQEHLRVQQWVALAYSDPARAAEELAGALRAGVERADRPEVARVARLTTVLSAPLAAEVELRRYAGAVERMATTGATSTTPPGSGAVSIGRERLPSMDRVVRLWNPQPAPDVRQQANVANEPANPRQAIVAEEPVIQQQTAEHVASAGYRVARVLVLGDNAVGKSALISRITGRDLRSRGGIGSDSRRWIVDRHGEEERDLVFVDASDEERPTVEMTAPAALVLVVGPNGREAAEGLLGRLGGTQPVFVVESSSAENPPSVPPDLAHLAKAARVAGVFSVNVRTGHGVGELKDPLVRVIDWSRTAASASRAAVDALEQLLEARFGSSPVAEFDENARRELRGRFLSTEPALAQAMVCLEARGILRIIGDPPRVIVRADAYGKCVGEIWRIAASGDQHPPGLPSVVYRTLEERFSAGGLEGFLNGAPGQSVLDLVLEDLTRRRWAFRVDSRDGRQVVIPSQFRAAPMSTEPPVSDLRPVLQARWPGTPSDMFVLQLVNFANLGRVDVHAPDRAYVHLSDGLLRMDGSVANGIAQLNLSASQDAADATVRDLFRYVMTLYLPGVAVELTDTDFTPADADAGVSQETEKAAPSGGAAPASSGTDPLEPPPGVDLARACLVMPPLGDRLVGERVMDFDAVWERLFSPAIEAVRLADGEPLVPVRVELPPRGAPLPDWMKAAPIVLVDLTGADAAHIRELGLVPGARTQHVVLVQETSDPPRGVADDQVLGYVYGGPDVLVGQAGLLAQRLAETLGVPGGGTGEGTATERSAVSIAAYVHGPVVPGETIRVRAAVYEEASKPDADRYLEAAGAVPGETAMGHELGTLPPRTSLHFAFSPDWDHTSHETQAEWQGGWVGTEASLAVPAEIGRSSAIVTVRVGGIDPPGSDFSLYLRIEPPAAAKAEPAQQTSGSPPTGSAGLEPPAGVDLAQACVVVLPSGTKRVGGRSIDLDAVWEHLFRPAIGDVRLPGGESLVPVRVSAPPTPGDLLPDWMKAAKIILVDVTGAETARLRDLWRMPGLRTQTVMLIGEADFVARLKGTTIQGYVFGSPDTLAGQRRDVAAALEKALGVPGGGTESGTGTLTITADRLNVRQGPGSEHPVVANLSKGARVERLDEADGWLRVRTADGVTGWISARFAVPESAESAEPVLGTMRVTAGTLSLRAGPGADHPVIMELPRGMVLDRLGVSADEQWIHVRSPDDFQGWVSARFVEQEVDAGPEPVFIAMSVPKILRPGESARVGVIAFPERSRREVEEFVRGRAPDDDVRWSPEGNPLQRGGMVEGRLMVPWEPNSQLTITFLWRGEWSASDLQFLVPADVPAGRAELRLDFETRETPEAHPMPGHSVTFGVGIVPPAASSTSAPPARTAYACYAATDWATVNERIATIRSAGVTDIFMDGDSTRMEEYLGARTAEEIRSRDLFLLFWSDASARSPWVEREWRLALEARAADGKPEIQIHLLEEEAAHLLPEELRHLHAMPVPEQPIVLISGEFGGMAEYRAAIVDACRHAGMETLSTDDAHPIIDIRESLRVIDDAHVYVGMIGHRYGYIPEGSDISMVEMEFEVATRRGIPRLIFILDDEVPVAPEHIDTGQAAEKLARLKARMKREAAVTYIKSPDGLRAAAIISLATVRRQMDPRPRSKGDELA